MWLGAFYHVGAGNESRAIYDGQELEEEPVTRIPADAEKHKSQGWGSYPLDSDKWWEELPSMRRRAERYGLVVMCLCGFDVGLVDKYFFSV